MVLVDPDCLRRSGQNGALTGQEAATNVASAAMRRLFAWVAGAAGGLAAYRALRRRRPHPEVADVRADELRTRIAEAKAAGDDRDEFEAGETTVDEAVPVDPDARRRAVHEQARGTLDDMRGE
jgi:hypothetical protein